MKYDLQEND